jgi:hypothetical protein
MRRFRTRKNAESPVGRSLESVLSDPVYSADWFIETVDRMGPLWFARPGKDDLERPTTSFTGIGWQKKRYAFAGILFASQQVVWARDDTDVLELDPDVAGFVRVLAAQGRGAWQTMIQTWSADLGWHLAPWATVGELDKRASSHTEVTRACDWVRFEEPPLAKFSYRAIEHVGDMIFYHATRKSHCRPIKRVGLLPAKRARAEVLSGRSLVGWTQLNFDLQDAVYLMGSQDYADAVATTLVGLWDEPAVILSVRGRDLDLRNLTVDEDALRDRYHGDVSDYGCLHGLPAYFTSLLWGEHLSVAYLGVIPPNKLRFETEVHAGDFD